jgi:NitT/TauT family transport system ATP-binding protein
MLTEAGREFATADVARSSELFREQVLKHLPFFVSVVETLKQRAKGGVNKEFFIDILDEHFTEAEAQRQFETIILWGRYARLLEYDATEERLYPGESVEVAS